MPRRRATAVINAVSEIVVSDPLPIEDLEDATVEDYKKLNDKLDNVMTKIKGRKESKRKQ